MKTTVSPSAKGAQMPVVSPAEPSLMRTPPAVGSAGRIAQLAAMINDSPVGQAQRQLAREMNGSPIVQAQARQAESMNQGPSMVAEPRQLDNERPAQRRNMKVVQQKQGRVSPMPMVSRDTDVKQPLASGELSRVKQRPAACASFEVGDQPSHVLQRMEGVVQLLGFRPGQPKQVVDWLTLHGLDQLPIFQGIVDRFNTNHTLEDDDAEAITLLFLTKEAPYREFAQADLAIQFIFWDVNKYSIPRHVTTVGQFTNAFKTFYHLYRRAENVGQPDPVADTYYGFLGIDAALGNVDTGAISFNTDESGSGADVHVAMIRNFAENDQLVFSSAESAISHLIKHGTFFNEGVKLTGHEPPGHLQYVYSLYIAQANSVVAHGVATQLPPTLGKRIFSFAYNTDTAIVSFDAATSSAELTTYFPTEPLDAVNDNI